MRWAVETEIQKRWLLWFCLFVKKELHSQVERTMGDKAWARSGQGWCETWNWVPHDWGTENEGRLMDGQVEKSEQFP